MLVGGGVKVRAEKVWNYNLRLIKYKISLKSPWAVWANNLVA